MSEFFEEFDKRDLALVYEADSRVSKLVDRDESGDRGAGRH